MAFHGHDKTCPPFYDACGECGCCNIEWVDGCECENTECGCWAHMAAQGVEEDDLPYLDYWCDCE